MSEASPTVSRYQPCASSRIEQRLGQPVQLLEVARVHPEAQAMRRFATSAANRSRATSRPAPAQVRSKPARELRVVGRVRPARPRRDVRSLRRAGRWRTPGSSGASRRAAHRLERPRGAAGSSRRARPGHRGRRPRRRRSLRRRRPPPRSPMTSASANTASSSNRRCSRGLEELVAPVDGRSQGLLALGEVARAAAQEAEPVVEPVAQDLRREQPEAGGGELDRQRQAVEPAADLRDGGRRCRPSARSPGRRRGRGRRTAARPRTRRWPAPWPGRGRAAGARAGERRRPARPGRGAPLDWWRGPSAPGSRSAGRRRWTPLR